MKILFATIFYPPSHIGGTEIYTHALAKQLQRTGHTVRVLCAEKWGEGHSKWNGYIDEIYEGVPVRRVCLNWTKMPEVNRSLYHNSVVADFFQVCVSEWEPDLVHVTSCQTLSASIIPAARRLGIPVVVTLTDFWFLCPRVTLQRSDGQLCDGQVDAATCLSCMTQRTKMARWSKALLPPSTQSRLLMRVSREEWLTRLPGLRGLTLNIEDRREVLCAALRQANHVIAPSQFVKTIFQNNDFDIPIDVIPHGNDLTWLSFDETKIPSQAIRFGYIGQILPIKGVHCLIEAFNMLPRQPPTELHLYGSLDQDPAYVNSLKVQAGDNAHIHFHGAFRRDELQSVFGTFDVLVVPSLWQETYGLVIQEAFAAHIPVIASAVGAIPEVVQDNVNGLVFEMGSTQALMHQMQRILDDTHLLPRLRSGIPPVKDIQTEATQLVQVYKNLLLQSGQLN